MIFPANVSKFGSGKVGSSFLIGGQSNSERDRNLPARLFQIGWSEFIEEMKREAIAFGGEFSIFRNPGGVRESERVMRFDQWLRLYPNPSVREKISAIVFQAIEDFKSATGFFPWVYLGDVSTLPEFSSLLGRREELAHYIKMCIDPFRRCPIVIDHSGKGDSVSVEVGTVLRYLGVKFAVEPEPKIGGGFENQLVDSFTQSNYWRVLKGSNPPYQTVPLNKRKGVSYVFLEEPENPPEEFVIGLLRDGVNVGFITKDGKWCGRDAKGWKTAAGLNIEN